MKVLFIRGLVIIFFSGKASHQHLKHLCRVYGKLLGPFFKLLLFSNPGDKVLILVESREQICPIVVHLFRTFSPGLEKNNTLKCWSGIFPLTLYYMVMLENCRNTISVHSFSPIQGTNFFFLLKFHEARISE